ncbi:hypothetical protein GCM10028807_62740 [Spirosoma daeguense]
MNAKYNRSEIMKSAWTMFRKGLKTFSDAIKTAWAVAKQTNVFANAELGRSYVKLSIWAGGGDQVVATQLLAITFDAKWTSLSDEEIESNIKAMYPQYSLQYVNVI